MAHHEVHLQVLGYREDGEYVALALEMDLRGYGDSFEEAMEDLADHIRMQLSFALEKTGSLESAFMQAEDKYFALYEQSRIERLRNWIGDLQQEYVVTGLPMPEPHVIEEMRGQFSANHA